MCLVMEPSMKHEQWPHPREEWFFSSLLLSAAPRLGTRAHELLACPYWNFDWGDFEQSFGREPQLLGPHKYNSYAICRRFYFTALPPVLYLFHPSCLFFQCAFHHSWGSVLITMSKFYIYSKCCINCREVHKLHKT